MSYTPMQQRAMDIATRDVLVSAGAGSGKTTVLTQRISQKLLAGDALKDFLIVTFTKESAADLRRKLGGLLEELIDKEKDEPRYRKMLYALPGAAIGTIDSFCLRHVKENAAVLGLNKGVAVGDEALCETLLAAAADNIITELCDRDDPDADLLLDNFAAFKNDKGLIGVMTGLYGSMRKYPFYLDWLDEMLAKHREEMEVLKQGEFFHCHRGALMKGLLKEKIEELRGYGAEVEAYAESDKEGDYALALQEDCKLLEAAVDRGYAAFCAAARTKPSYRKPNKTGEEYTAASNRFRAERLALAKLARTEEELMAEYGHTKRVLESLARAVKRLDEDYSRLKAERGMIDFADAEQLFLKLLLEKTEEGYVKTSLCKSIASAYKEVFIDEYQDVSPLQDAIFTAIGGGRRFMVGDLKQSIYGFRDAYPDIFMSYRDSFAPAEEEKDTAVIYLTHNFRCDKPIIRFCNYLFDRTFTLKSADTDYTKERLEFGKDKTGKEKVSLTVIERADKDKEADYVAEQVVKCIYEGYEPKDIAILTRETADLQKLALALEKRGVPCAANKTADTLLSQAEVLLALSLLRVIDNPTDDISLAAILRSPIFRFTAAELVRIRACGGTGISLYGNLCGCAEAEGELGAKCKAFLDRLGLYRTKALAMPVHSLIWYLYEDTHLLLFAPEGKEKRFKDNLFMLYELAGGMAGDSYRGVSAFVEYVNRLEQEGRSPKAATAKAEGAVSLLTIHGSKGLEYPVVFVMGTMGTIKKMHHSDSMLSNYRTGVSVKLANQKEGWRISTLLFDLSVWEQDKRILAEEYRLFYVAFTRAKERLYISAALSDSLEDYLSKVKYVPSKQADLFLPCLAQGGDDSYELKVADGGAEIPATVLASAMARGELCPPLPDMKELPPSARLVTAKYSVSRVKRMEDGTLGLDTEELVTDRKPDFLGGGASTGALIGTATHAFLQFANYKEAERDGEAEAKRLCDKGFISAEDRDRLDFNALRGFFGSPLYAEIKASPKVYREKRFTTELPARLFGAEGESVLVQGVIDCFFINDKGTYTLVDYKTDYVKEGGEAVLTERYGTQLYLYSLYIEKLTGIKVERAYLYSLSINKAIPCQIQNFGI